MTNKEKYGNEIIELAARKFGLKNGKPVLCTETKCKDCDFCEKDSGSCKGSAYNFREWLNSEYVEPPVDWSKVAIDTPILVKDNEEERWKKRHFAKYEDGKVYVYCNGTTSWSVRRSDNISGWDMAKLAESEE